MKCIFLSLSGHSQIVYRINIAKEKKEKKKKQVYQKILCVSKEVSELIFFKEYSSTLGIGIRN